MLKGNRNDFEDAFNNPNAWYIVDGVLPKLACKGRTVLLTSPKYETYAVRWGLAFGQRAPRSR